MVLAGSICRTSVLRADEVVPPGYRLVAVRNGIPPAMLYAVALAEIGTRIQVLGSLRPWRRITDQG